MSTPQQGSGQRASPILQFDTPRISSSAFSALQNSALLNASRQVVVGEEKTKLELELRRSVIETVTPGTPGRPGTPDTVSTTTTNSTSLSADALDALQQLIDSFPLGDSGHTHGHHHGPGGYGDGYDARVLQGLQDNLARFADTVGSQAAGRDLGEVIGRLENSVIGKGGLDFFDLFRDPRLFATLAQGLGRFEQQTGSDRAAAALGNLILAVGDPSFGNGSGNSNSNSHGTRRVGAAIDQLADSLAGNSRAAVAVDDFLNLLQGRATGGSDGYSQGGHHHGGHGGVGSGTAGQIAGILNDALTDLQGGSLDAGAVQRLQDAATAIGNLQDSPGRRDDRLRQRAIGGLQDILDRYTTVSQNTETVVTPGQPAVPGTPGHTEITYAEQVSLVPRVEIAQRVVTVYQSVQNQLKPLQKLSEQPPPTPNLLYLVQQPAQDPKQTGRDSNLLHPADRNDQKPQNGQNGQDQQDQNSVIGRSATDVIAALYAARQPGRQLDTRI